MRKEEHINIIPERKEVTITYYGNCPECNKEQISKSTSNIDVICSECSLKKQQATHKMFLDNFIGSELIGIVNDSTIIIKTKDKKVYELWFHRDEDNNSELDISEIHSGNAEWFL